MKHSLIKTGDPDAFEQIQDRNGEVVLSYCRVCHEGEGTLADSCPGLRACCTRTRDEERKRQQALALTVEEVVAIRKLVTLVVLDTHNTTLRNATMVLVELLKRTGNQP